MKRIVKYTAIDPYYSDITQTYIGSTIEELDNIQWETEKSMGSGHTSIDMIYKIEIVNDDIDNSLLYHEGLLEF